MSLETEREIVIGRAVALFARDQGLPVAYAGYDFNPAVQVPGNASRDDGPNDNLYLALASIRIPPDTRGLTNGWAIRDFIQQVDVYVRDGLGEIAALKRAEALCDAFHFGREIVGDTHTYIIFKAPSIAPSIKEDTWRKLPVSITFRTVA